MACYSLDRSRALFTCAEKVIPAGIYGHQSPRFPVIGSFAHGEEDIRATLKVTQETFNAVREQFGS